MAKVWADSSQVEERLLGRIHIEIFQVLQVAKAWSHIEVFQVPQVATAWSHIEVATACQVRSCKGTVKVLQRSHTEVREAHSCEMADKVFYRIQAQLNAMEWLVCQKGNW